MDKGGRRVPRPHTGPFGEIKMNIYKAQDHLGGPQICYVGRNNSLVAL